MALPIVGTAVNYYPDSSGVPVPALALYLDDIKSQMMVSYIAKPPGGVSGQLANIIVSPWGTQGTGAGQWEPTS